MKKKKEELIIGIYDENGPNINEVILKAFEKYMKLQLMIVLI